MRAVVLTLCVSLAGALTATGFQPASAIAVTLDVSVLDRGGRPVPGLSAADFTAQLDGSARPILAVTYLPAGAPMAGGIGPVFDAVTPATAPVYRIVVQPPDGTPAGTLFAAAVAVSRADTTVLADTRAVAAPLRAGAAAVRSTVTAAPRSIEERLRDAIATGRPQRELAIAFASSVRRAADPAQVALEVAIEMPASARAPLTALLGIVDAHGAIRTAKKAIDAPAGDGTYQIDFTVTLAPGTYKVRFAAADAADAIGAVEAAVTAELVRMGPLSASALLRWTAAAAGDPHPLIGDVLPAGTVTVGTTLELYAADGAGVPPDLLVTVSLSAADGREPPLIERIVTPEIRDGVLVAEAEFPVARMGNGTYALRATVTSGTVALGALSATLTKR